MALAGTKKAVEIPQINREIISLFLALQLQRTAEARIILVQFARELQTIGELRNEYDPEKDARGLLPLEGWRVASLLLTIWNNRFRLQ